MCRDQKTTLLHEYFRDGIQISSGMVANALNIESCHLPILMVLLFVVVVALFWFCLFCFREKCNHGLPQAPDAPASTP